MKPSAKSRANLRRGGIMGTAETARRARQAKATTAAEVAALGTLAGEDPHAAYVELHSVMTRHVVRLLRAEERDNAKPSRDVTDRLREYRALTEALLEYRQSRGAAQEVQTFFDELDTRVERILQRMPMGPQPVVKPDAAHRPLPA